MSVRWAGPPRAPPRRRLLYLLLTSAKAGTGPSGVVRVAEGGWAGGGEVRSAELQPEPGEASPRCLSCRGPRRVGVAGSSAASGASYRPGLSSPRRPASLLLLRRGLGVRWGPRSPPRAASRAARVLRERGRGRARWVRRTPGPVRVRAGIGGKRRGWGARAAEAFGFRVFFFLCCGPTTRGGAHWPSVWGRTLSG